MNVRYKLCCGLFSSFIFTKTKTITLITRPKLCQAFTTIILVELDHSFKAGYLNKRRLHMIHIFSKHFVVRSLSATFFNRFEVW